MRKRRRDFAQKLEPFPSRSGATELSPVRLPPGRARLGTRPVPIGSPTATMTSGTVVVAFFTASAAEMPAVTIASTFAAMSSATNTGKWSYFPIRPAVFNDDIAAFLVAKLPQAFTECVEEIGLDAAVEFP